VTELYEAVKKYLSVVLWWYTDKIMLLFIQCTARIKWLDYCDCTVLTWNRLPKPEVVMKLWEMATKCHGMQCNADDPATLGHFTTLMTTNRPDNRRDFGPDCGHTGRADPPTCRLWSRQVFARHYMLWDFVCGMLCQRDVVEQTMQTKTNTIQQYLDQVQQEYEVSSTDFHKISCLQSP